jgi:hypothetical protein
MKANLPSSKSTLGVTATGASVAGVSVASVADVAASVLAAVVAVSDAGEAVVPELSFPHAANEVTIIADASAMVASFLFFTSSSSSFEVSFSVAYYFNINHVKLQLYYSRFLPKFFMQYYLYF